ncbi:MAG: LacI family DNA-binding transcriptional regulator [Clostridia bacterium]
MANISDVAKMAGVSKATVSRVLNDLPVSRETLLKVTRAMRKLDYHPNAQARGLTLGRTNLIGVLVPGLDSPFYSPMLDSIETTLSRHGYHMVVSGVGQNIKRSVSYVHLLREKKIDGGLILTPRDVDVAAITKLASDGFPIVILDGSIDADVSCVVVDNFNGGLQAARHLLSLGHTRTAMIAGPADLPESRERIRGYEHALEEAGLTPNVIACEDYSEECGRAGIEAALAQSPRPSAVFCASDMMAIGAMEALEEKGLRVPDDMAVIGFDDIRDAHLVRPRLSTVHQPIAEMGSIGTGKLLRLISGEEKDYTRLVLKTELVVRDSCGARSGRPAGPKAQTGSPFPQA